VPTRIDVLIVGRGGGSLEDLWSFNEEVVVRAIHGSRIPVISAVGHEIDVTLSDLVADVRALTPSEAAELLAPAADEVVIGLRRHERRLLAALRTRTAAARAQLESISARRVFRRPMERVQSHARRLDELEGRSTRAAHRRVAQARVSVEHFGAQLEALSPSSVLSRGYSITRRTSDGRVIRDAAELAEGDQLETRFAEGRAVSEVRKTAI
jgi:exodeoxyribonuclease VII large subunit